ncbi:MAG: arsenosugar biosynthesis radical SAM protein ArsS [Sandaracinaceae bacterium]
MPTYLPTLSARRAPLSRAETQRAVLARTGVPSFDETLAGHGLSVEAARLDVLQVNLGKVCNQSCRHCHVDAGPDRTERMSRRVLEACVEAAVRCGVRTVDFTGGAPELHPDFRWAVETLRGRGIHVMVRCNLTVLLLPSQEDLAEMLAASSVEVVCSLPHWARLSTDRQRGDGVFDKSIRALRRLNALGYAARPELRLVVVTNPVGAFLPGDQRALEREWKRELGARHGIAIDALYTITNMPISRYLEWLEESGNTERYLSTLVRAFNPRAVEGLMCRTMLSVGWDGRLHDCDFNQMLEIEVLDGPRTIDDLARDGYAPRRVATDRHCYGCTAGAGSSCGGVIT